VGQMRKLYYLVEAMLLKAMLLMLKIGEKK
jgi:hypothetical protein